MKSIYKTISGIAAASAMLVAFSSCNDVLDITPPSDVTPETYFTTADQLGAYTIYYYKSSDVVGSRGSNIFPHFGNGGSAYAFFLNDDEGTDNESGTNDRFYQGTDRVKVGTSGGSWDFYTINEMNYFLETVLPRYEAGQISGSDEAIRHYIGEGYLIRATSYFQRLCALGDFPIITETLPLDKPTLIEASKRRPRNEVARFILSDLDKAIEYLSDGSETGGRNRITKDVAYLFKARVALYEATWEKYFAGTPFVPDKDAGWPGASMGYLADYSYDNATEVAFFLDEALAASKYVCEKHPTLVPNNKQMLGERDGFANYKNQYYLMFATQDPSNYDEALMYRVYDIDIAGGHSYNQYIQAGHGYTQEYANCFLMDNGLPIYDANSGYAGDDFVVDTKTNRDWRWKLFMKAPNEYVYADSDEKTLRIGEGKKNKKDDEFKAPAIVSGGVDFSTTTGYQKGKGWATDATWNKGGWDLTSAIIFRSAEAYLIYMEAACEKYGDNLDDLAWELWGKLRTRAGLPSDAHVTINATVLDKEEEYTHDFALYSAGKRITSPVLYNIRRERRCELISEGLRWDDLMRWRALDQLQGQHYYKHGCKMYGPMWDWFKQSKYKYGQANPDDNKVSDPSDVEGGLNGDARYLSLQRVSTKSEWYASGYSWHMAHYLSPIAENHFIESETVSGDISSSPIYQNPYWSTTHDTGAQK